jgi:uncharacterized membrane protein
MKPANKTSFSTRASRLAHWLTGNWLKVTLGFFFLYVALPFAAPVLMKLGAEGPASVIYTLYKPLCHELGFRSIFLFGEQAVYPLEQAGVGGVETYQAYVKDDPEFLALFAGFRGVPASEITADDLAPYTAELQAAAREHVGNDRMGYKVSLCQRDIAIYAAIFIGGLLFARVRRKLRPAPLLLYLVLGIGPIALDGGSQLLGTPPLSLWPMRETWPHLRIITGALFGLMNVWLAFPYLEMSMTEIHQSITANKARLETRDAARARLEAFKEAWVEEEDHE